MNVPPLSPRRWDAHHGRSFWHPTALRLPLRTVAAQPTCAAQVAAVISSPILGVFAVTAAGPGLRRGHVIYSGVFAVAAVTAAGVPCLVHSLACPGEFCWGVPGSLISSRPVRGAAGHRMAVRSSWASWAFQVTVVVRIVPAPRWAGLCGRPGGVVAAASASATARY